MTDVAKRPILLADRDESSRNRLATALAGDGYEPLAVRTGSEAVELARVELPRRRVIPITILDVALPDLSGIETFELIGSVGGKVEGIFLSETRDKETLVRLLDAGAYTVLNKPPRLDWLLRAVRELSARIERESEGNRTPDA